MKVVILLKIVDQRLMKVEEIEKLRGLVSSEGCVLSSEGITRALKYISVRVSSLRRKRKPENL